MFQKTRFVLTAWYVLILMAVSIVFSIFLYTNISRELDRALRMQKFRIQHPEYQLHIFKGNHLQLPFPVTSDPDVIQDSKNRALGSLILINSVLFLFSSLGGYFLAGRTLRPIQEMLEEQKRFVGDASHELRTPLTSLRTEIEVSLRNKDISLKDAKDLLKSNLEEVIALQVLSDNLLILSQSEKGVVLEPVSLDKSLEQAVKTIMPLAKAKNIAIKNTSNNISVRVIPEKLMQVWIIILDNAIKYSPEGSIVVIRAKQEENRVIVAITDNGIGISKDDIKHVFDRFYRVSKSRSKNEIPGYGLGLSIAKKIVELFDGTISLTSEVGKGTTVKVELKLA